MTCSSGVPSSKRESETRKPKESCRLRLEAAEASPRESQSAGLGVAMVEDVQVMMKLISSWGERKLDVLRRKWRVNHWSLKT